MRTFIANEVKKREIEYKNNPTRAIQDYNRENEDKDSYHGRELLELLQNADDEISDPDHATVEIKLENSILTISNDGNPFSKEGIVSLMYSNVSPKRGNNEVIGNKGTGFRSVLSWTKEIYINSADLHIRYTPEYSQKKLDRILNQNSVKNRINAAVLAFPEWISDPVQMKYTTEISLCVKDDYAEKDINEQMMKIDGDILLFLNNINELIIETEGTVNTIRKSVMDSNTVRIDYYVNGEINPNRSGMWNIFKSLNNTYEGKNYSVVLAYNQYRKSKNNYLYSYFPTKIEFCFPFLLHADFDLNSNRNHLIKNEANKAVLSTAADLIVKSAIELFDDVSYDRLKFSIPPVELCRELKEFGFDRLLNDRIQRNPMFPTVNRSYVVFNKDEHIFTDGELSKLLSGKHFSSLLMFSDDVEIKRYIKECGMQLRYRYIYLAETISMMVEEWKVNKRNINRIAKIIIELINEYSGDKSISETPLKIFYNLNDKLIDNKNPIYIRSGELNISKLPRFARIEFLSEGMVEALSDILGDSLYDTLVHMNIYKYSIKEIVENLNHRIIEIEQNNKNRSHKYALDVVLWLWDNKKLITNEKLNVTLPSRNGGLIYSQEAYYGYEYGNEIGEAIISLFDSDSFILDLSKEIDAEKEEIIEFIEMLGVSKYPRIIKRKLTNDKQYFERIVSGFKYPYRIDNKVFESSEELINEIQEYSIEVSDIDRFDYILQKAHTSHIIRWLIEDPQINGIISAGKEKLETGFSIRLKRYWGDRTVKEKTIYPYILWKLQTVSWIEDRNSRYRVDDCLLTSFGDVSIAPLLVNPPIDTYIENIPGRKKKIFGDFVSILEKIGVKRDFADLPPKKIYDVLFDLPNYDNSKLVVKGFYESMINDADDLIKRTNNCYEYKRFLSSGSVLCTSGQYCTINETKFVGGKRICSRLLSSFNIMDIPKGRINYKSIPKLFGIERIELKGVELTNYSEHYHNNDFQKDFSRYKALAFAYRYDSKKDEKGEARRFNRIKIELCSIVTISYEGKTIDLEPFDYLAQGNNQYYLCVPNEVDLYDTRVGIEIANIICADLDVYGIESELRELYMAQSERNRKMILDESVGELTLNRALKTIYGGSDTRNEFLHIVEELSEKKDKADIIEQYVREIEFENLNSINNYDLIIELFKKLDIDVDQYNALDPTVRIDLTGFYRGIINNEIAKYREAYRCALYEKYKNKGIDDKKHLQEEILLFDSITVEPINTVDYDINKAIMEALDITTSDTNYNITDIYKKNYREFLSLYSDIDKDVFDEYLKRTEIASLLYYAEFVVIHGSIIEELKMIEKTNQTLSNDNTEKEPIEVCCRKVDVVKSAYFNYKTVKSGKTKKTTGYTKKHDEGYLLEMGCLGEKYVYEYLSKRFNTNNVNWLSENAKKLNINPEGAADRGYDMEYVDEIGERYFVEVKASVNPVDKGIMFYLSENEYRFGITNSNRYVIFYVGDVRGNKPELIELRDVFVDNQFNNMVYTANVIEYYISADIKQQDKTII